MIFRLKTSKKTMEIFNELEKRTNYKPYTLVKHAIAWSIKENISVKDFESDSEGLDLNRQTITGDYDEYFKVLVEQVEGRHLTDEEYFPRYVKAHIDRGRACVDTRTCFSCGCLADVDKTGVVSFHYMFTVHPYKVHFFHTW